MDDLQPSIAPDELYAQLGRAAASIVGRLLVAAVPRSVDTLQRWLGELPVDRQVVVYGVSGDKIARQVAVELRAVGIRTQFLEGGIEGWVRAGRAIAGFCRTTRERPKIDRIAGPWLIRRFIDPGATFICVPSAREPWLAAGTTLQWFKFPPRRTSPDNKNGAAMERQQLTY